MKGLNLSSRPRLARENLSHRSVSRGSRWSKLWKAAAVPLAACALASVLATSAHAVTLNWSAVNEPGVGGQVTSIRVSPFDSNRVVVGGDMLGPTYSTDGGNAWNDTFGMQNWECGDMTWHPSWSNDVWLGTMGGPYKSVDYGKTWTAKRGGMPTAETYWGFTAPIQKVLVDPNNNTHLIAVGGSHREWDGGITANTRFGAIWDSTNYGDSWTLKTTILGDGNGKGANIRDAAYAPGNSSVLYAAVWGGGVYKSIDGGSNWGPKNNGLAGVNVSSIAVSPTDGNTLWCTVQGKGTIYKSTNGGDSWFLSNSGIAFDGNYDHYYPKIAVAKTNANVLYVASDSWQTVYKSTDGGANWSATLGNNNKPDAPTGLGPQGQWIEIDPNNENTVYVCNSVTIFKTTNGGANWGIVSASAGSSTGTWKGRGYSGYVSTKIAWNPFKTSQCVLQAMDDGKFMQSTDGLNNWRLNGAGLNQWSGGTDVTFGNDGQTIYGSFSQNGSYDGIAKSTNGGLNWSYVNSPGGGDTSAIYTQPNSTGNVWLIRGGRLYGSNNSGSNWNEISVNGDVELRKIAADPNTPQKFYVSSRYALYKTTNGSSFQTLANFESSDASNISIDPNNSDRVYLAAWHYNQYHCGVYRYDSNGFNRINFDYSAHDVAVDPSNSNRVVMVTDYSPGVDVNTATGVWMTENALDANPTWTQQNNGLPMYRVSVVAFNPDKSGQLIVGLNGRGFYKANTGVGSGSSTPTPTPNTTNLIANPSFDAENYDTQTPSGWSKWGPNPAASYTESYGGSNSGARHATHWSSSAYQVYTYQLLTGLPNGTYTLSCYAKSGGGQTNCYMEAINYGGNSLTANLLVSSSYQLVQIPNIVVTNGQCQVGFWSDAGANQWCYFDDVSFTQNNCLTGTYFDNIDFTGTMKSRLDKTVNYNWGTASPIAGIAPTTNSIRWTGRLIPKYSQAYTFYVNADSNVRLWVNGVQIINSWTNASGERRSATINLTANQKYAIKLEYAHNTGNAYAQLSWQSSSQAKQIVPDSATLPN